MNNTFKDFSGLKKIKPSSESAHAPQPKVTVKRDDHRLDSAANSQDYFSSLLGNKKTQTAAKSVQKTPQHTVVTPGTISRVREEQASLAFAKERENLLAEIEEQKAAVEELARELVEAEAARDAANGELAKLKDELAAVSRELEDEKAKPRIDEKLLAESEEKNREIERLKTLLIEAQQTSLSSSVLIDKPAGIGEKFPGEIREHVLETLKLALDASECSGRERRARLLEAVLCTNISSGELENRRNAVRQLVLDEGNAVNEATIAKFERLGFKYLSGRNHHKFNWAGHRYIVSKTPSDHRSAQNSAADICNRIF